MAGIGDGNPTLLDVASRTKDGKIQTVVEVLTETNEILDDATFLECNNGSSHKAVIRTGLPSGTWRKLNYGVAQEKSRTAQIEDACGMLESYSKVDKALADLNGNVNEFRFSEDKAFLEGMNQTFASTYFYGDTSVDPEKFMGLAPRFSSLSAENGENIIDASGSGSDNSSIWLVVHGPQTVHCLYPKGSKAGLHHRDLGEDTLTDANGNEYQGYRTHYKFDPGLAVKDWRYVVRIANIDISDLNPDPADGGADLIDLMDQAIELPPNLSMGRACFYANRKIRSFIKRQAKNHKSAHLSREDVMTNGRNKKQLMFDGIPVKRCDAILNTEEAVS